MAIKKQISWWELLKRAFIVLIVLQMIPVILVSLKKGFGEMVYPKPKVARVNIRGMLTDSRRIVKQIRKFADQDDIKAILLYIDSPGGTPATAQLISSEISRVKTKKPVISLVENMCASGAYYIAAASDHIVAPASSVVGSIGVMAMIPNVKRLFEDWNISMDVLRSGKFKTVANPFGDPMTEEERLYRQDLSDDVYTTFVRDIARTRGLSVDQKDGWADGKIFTGSQALELGLIDQVGDMTDVEQELKKRGDFEGDIKYVTAPKPSIFARMFSADDDDEMQSEVSASLSTAISDAYFAIVSQSGRRLG